MEQPSGAREAKAGMTALQVTNHRVVGDQEVRRVVLTEQVWQGLQQALRSVAPGP